MEIVDPMGKDRKQYLAEYYKKTKQAKKAPKQTVENVDLKDLTELIIPETPVGLSEKILNRVESLESEPLLDRDSTDLNLFQLRKWFIIAGLICFIVANTTFLVNEQLRFYELRGESFVYSLAVSILSEAAVILLSFFYARSRDIWMKLRIGVILALTVGCILTVICLGVDRKQSVEQKNAEISELMHKEIEVLKPKLAESPRLASTLSKKELDLRVFLQKNNVLDSTLETIILVMLRLLSLSWNVIFATLIAFILSEKYAK